MIDLIFDTWEISYMNRCREDKVIEAINLFEKPLKKLGFNPIIK